MNPTLPFGPLVKEINRCNTCARLFDSLSKLKMHNIRLHPARRSREADGTFNIRKTITMASMTVRITEMQPEHGLLMRNVMLTEWPAGECHSKQEIANILKRSEKFATNLSFGVWDKNDLVGFLLTRIDRENLHAPYIHTLFVRLEYRQKTLGSELIDLMIRKCHEHRVVFRFTQVTIHAEETNRAAIRLYERLGFRHVERIDNDYGPGRHAIVMSKQLSN